MTSTNGVRPAPFRTDGSNAFAYHSMAVRVPCIIHEITERNPDYPSSIKDVLERLREALINDEPLALFDPPEPDYDLWLRRFAAHRGDTWLGAEWFFAEMLVYRWMVHVTRFWDTLRDPFAPVKEEEMTSPALWEALMDVLGTSGSLPERLAAHGR